MTDKVGVHYAHTLLNYLGASKMLRKPSKLQRSGRLNVGTKSGSWKTSISEPGPNFMAAILISTSQNFLGFGRRKGGRKDCHQAVNYHCILTELLYETQGLVYF